MGQQRKLISVLVPTRNRPLLLAETLASLAAQTFPDFEVIVVNDGGEAVEGVVARFLKPMAIKLVTLSQSQGQPEALNIAVRESEGEFLAFCDDDDLLARTHLETLHNALVQNSDYLLAYSNVYAFQDDVNHPVGLLRQAYSIKKLRQTNYFCTCSVLFYRELYEKTGEFDNTLPSYWDWDFFLKAAQYGDFYHVDEVLSFYRVHAGSMQITQGDEARKSILNKLCLRHHLGDLPLKKLSDHFEA